MKITKNMETLIDEVDADLANAHWCAHTHTEKSSVCHYAVRNAPEVNGKRLYPTTIQLHRVILSRMVGRELRGVDQVDHINHNGLDNRRANLRLATPTQNHANQRTQRKIKSSRFKGVCWNARDRKWQVNIKKNNKQLHVGNFDSEIDAAKAYDEKAKQMFEEFCCLNFPNTGYGKVCFKKIRQDGA